MCVLSERGYRGIVPQGRKAPSDRVGTCLDNPSGIVATLALTLFMFHAGAIYFSLNSMSKPPIDALAATFMSQPAALPVLHRAQLLYLTRRNLLLLTCCVSAFSKTQCLITGLSSASSWTSSRSSSSSVSSSECRRQQSEASHAWHCTLAKDDGPGKYHGFRVLLAGDNLFFRAWQFHMPRAILSVPQAIVEALVWSIITYWLLGLAPEASR